MAIANTKLSHTFWGNKKVVFGKSVISGATNTGDVTLAVIGLKRVDAFWFSVNRNAAEGMSVEEAFPCRNDITIHTTTNDMTVYWTAVGVPK